MCVCVGICVGSFPWQHKWLKTSRGKSVVLEGASGKDVDASGGKRSLCRAPLLTLYPTRILTHNDASFITLLWIVKWGL